MKRGKFGDNIFISTYAILTLRLGNGAIFDQYEPIYSAEMHHNY
ncbi:MAG: hypothetical protein PVI26_03685 [Chitinispirillia bacterium]|jgi:hypothetical protein